MNALFHIQRSGIKPIHHAALIHRATLRGSHIQRLFRRAVDHFVRPFVDGLTQQFIGGVAGEGRERRAKHQCGS